MAAKRQIKSGFVLFDVFYADGSRISNRKVPAELLGGFEGDEPARTAIEEQDREIGNASGKPRPAIEAVLRAGASPRSGAARRD